MRKYFQLVGSTILWRKHLDHPARRKTDDIGDNISKTFPQRIFAGVLEITPTSIREPPELMLFYGRIEALIHCDHNLGVRCSTPASICFLPEQWTLRIDDT